MLNRISTVVISPETAALDGFYRWVGADNDCPWHGFINGYVCGFCVEVRKPDGTLDYTSCAFVSAEDGTDILLPETDDGTLCDEWNELGIAAQPARLGSYKATGRIVFRGYYTAHYDWDEREEYFRNASEEVERLWSKWVI